MNKPLYHTASFKYRKNRAIHPELGFDLVVAGNVGAALTCLRSRGGAQPRSCRADLTDPAVEVALWRTYRCSHNSHCNHHIPPQYPRHIIFLFFTLIIQRGRMSDYSDPPSDSEGVDDFEDVCDFSCFAMSRFP